MAQPHQVEVTTAALDAFLAEPRPPRLLQGEEALARLRALFDNGAPKAPSPEYLHHRILVFWRLARAAAKIAGICAEDEALDGATEVTPNPWHEGLKMSLTAAQQSVLRRSSASQLIALFAGGLPLLPPTDSHLAKRWCAAMSILVGDLGIERTHEGLLGLEGVLHPKTCGYSSVTPEQILAVEELLIDEAQKLIVESGERPAIEHFRSRYGFSRKEAIGLIRLARADALAVGGSSTEEDRAIMVANLKDLIARAKDEMNSDKELKALKQLAAIQGLTRTEPEDMARDFMKVIGAVAARQDRQLEAPREKRQIPSNVPETVQYTVVDPAPAAEEDAEDLAEYDRENAR